MSAENEPPPPVEEPPISPGVINRVKWTYWSIHSWLWPMSREEILAKLESWRSEVGISDIQPSAIPNRCCVMRIARLGVRCSTEPRTDVECRALARKFDPDAIAHFYSDRPCINCTPLR